MEDYVDKLLINGIKSKIISEKLKLMYAIEKYINYSPTNGFTITMFKFEKLKKFLQKEYKRCQPDDIAS